MEKSLIKDKTLFCNLVGYSRESKILELFIEVREHQYTFNQVINILKINRQEGYAILRRFKKEGILIEVEKIKQQRYHKLNNKDPRTKNLIKLFDSVLKARK
tara:strand:- start:889 stop:1194 length:306 start_codon:yes stop_codon:yes gene_type:complete